MLAYFHFLPTPLTLRFAWKAMRDVTSAGLFKVLLQNRSLDTSLVHATAKSDKLKIHSRKKETHFLKAAFSML